MIAAAEKKRMSHHIDVILVNEGEIQAPSFDQFAQWLQPLAAHLNLNKELCIKIVDAQESQSLNAQYRGKDKPTNVLSFPSELPEFVESQHLGDLAICADVVVSEAQEQGKKDSHHWAHLTIHGCLHLLGYDHIEADDAAEMEALEIELLAGQAIPNPYELGGEA